MVRIREVGRAAQRMNCHKVGNVRLGGSTNRGGESEGIQNLRVSRPFEFDMNWWVEVESA